MRILNVHRDTIPGANDGNEVLVAPSDLGAVVPDEAGPDDPSMDFDEPDPFAGLDGDRERAPEPVLEYSPTSPYHTVPEHVAPATAAPDPVVEYSPTSPDHTVLEHVEPAAPTPEAAEYSPAPTPEHLPVHVGGDDIAPVTPKHASDLGAHANIGPLEDVLDERGDPAREVEEIAAEIKKNTRDGRVWPKDS